MSRIGESWVYDHSPQDNPDHFIAHIFSASPEAVQKVLAADPDLDDGFARSEWVWVRLRSGDLVLGLLPQDDTYFELEEEHSR